MLPIGQLKEVAPGRAETNTNDINAKFKTYQYPVNFV